METTIITTINNIEYKYFGRGDRFIRTSSLGEEEIISRERNKIDGRNYFLHGDKFYFAVGWTYERDSNREYLFGMYRCNLDGTNIERLTRFEPNDYSFSICNDSIFYTLRNGIYRCNLDGSSNTRILPSGEMFKHLEFKTIFNNKLFFTAEVGRQERLYRCDFDGDNIELINHGKVKDIFNDGVNFYAEVEYVFDYVDTWIMQGGREKGQWKSRIKETEVKCFIDQNGVVTSNFLNIQKVNCFKLISIDGDQLTYRAGDPSFRSDTGETHLYTCNLLDGSDNVLIEVLPPHEHWKFLKDSSNASSRAYGFQPYGTKRPWEA